MGKKVLLSSIGKKLIMSITGIFLVLFLAFHLCMNLVLVFDAEAYNAICGFLGANWYALIGTAVLAGGVAIHFLFAFILTIENLMARGNIRYAVTAKEQNVEWASKNMFLLGAIVILGLCIHFINFWSKMQLVEIMGGHEAVIGGMTVSPTDGAAIVKYTLSQWYFALIYIVWFVALWFHLTHGMWSMLHTAGLNNKYWFKPLKCISSILATILAGGYMIIVFVIYFCQQ